MDTEKSPGLREHCERFLGRGRRSTRMPAGARGEFLVAEYANAPCEGAVTLLTRGLALLGRGPHQELLLSCYERFATPALTSLVGAVGLQLLDAKDGLERGDILGPAGPLAPGLRLEALYACPPTYFPDDFRFASESGRRVELVWLIPLHASEARWIADRTSEMFEDKLEEIDPDLLDLSRPPLTL